MISFFSQARVVAYNIPTIIKEYPKLIMTSLIPVVGPIFAVMRNVPLMTLGDLTTYPENIYIKKFITSKILASGLLIQSIALIASCILLCPVFFKNKKLNTASALVCLTMITLGTSVGLYFQTLADQNLYRHFKNNPREMLDKYGSQKQKENFEKYRHILFKSTEV